MRITIDTEAIKDKILEIIAIVLAFIIKPFLTKRRKRGIQIYLKRKYLKERREQINRLFGNKIND